LKDGSLAQSSRTMVRQVDASVWYFRHWRTRGWAPTPADPRPFFAHGAYAYEGSNFSVSMRCQPNPMFRIKTTADVALTRFLFSNSISNLTKILLFPLDPTPALLYVVMGETGSAFDFSYFTFTPVKDPSSVPLFRVYSRPMSSFRKSWKSWTSWNGYLSRPKHFSY
jgi:hypothetical protein